MSQYSLGVDVGGTFTDVVLCDHIKHQLFELKVPTTKGQTTRGIIQAIREVAAAASTDPRTFETITIGTTTGTNAVLEKKGTPLALVTTRGFRHVVDIGRHDVPKDVNMYTWEKPDKLVRPRDVFEVCERVDPDGMVVTAIDPAEVRRVLEIIRARGLRTVAVCLLHSYANPSHERTIRRVAAEEFQDLVVTISSDVLPVFREYERSVVTVMNAYLMPLFRDYADQLTAGLAGERVDASVWVMQSNGGLFSLHSAAEHPVTTILSGPAAGVKGAEFVGAMSNEHRLLTLDVGGTSADIALIEAEGLSVRRDAEISGLPLNVPMLDIKTIGAGGGSIARVTMTGNLTVGPDSAGSEPGPVCYGRGGTEPTVTDAHAVLGHLGGGLLNGTMQLDVQAARRAIGAAVAAPLKLGIEQAAKGILDIINENMAGALREVTVERGHDPRDYTLVAFGGAGPLHASELCRLLGIKRFIAPANSGVLSALGMLTTDLQSDFSRTSILRENLPDVRVLTEVYRDLEGQASRWLEAERAAPELRRVQRQVDIRYRNQGYEVTIPMPEGELTEASVKAARAAFDVEHERLYGFKMDGTPVEWVTLRVSAVSSRSRVTPELLRNRLNRAETAVSEPARRQVYDPGTGVFRDIPVWPSGAIAAGRTVQGPTIIELATSTVLVLAGDVARIDEYGDVVVEVAQP